MRKIVVILSAIVLLSSCAGFTHVTVPCSPVNMGDRDMETERKVSYTLTKTFVLGIGGMSERARNTDIIAQLFRKANLKKNESLAYIGITKNINNYLGIVVTAKYTATGYVVRPVGETSEEDEGTRNNAYSVTENTPIKQEKQNNYLSKEYDRLMKRAKEYTSVQEKQEIKFDSKQLHEEGVINQEEYQKIKKALSDRSKAIQQSLNDNWK